MTLASRAGDTDFGNPRHRRIEHHNDVGARQHRLDVEAEIHRMSGRKIEIVRFALHHRQRILLRERGQRLECLRRTAERRSQDQRELRAGDQIGYLFDSVLRRHCRHRAEPIAAAAALRCRFVGQHFARQRQVNRPARLAHGDVECTIDDGRDRLSGPQFVVPLGEFTHHAALVEGFLTPMDRPVARGLVPGLGNRRAAGSEQYRDIVARRIHDAVDGVAGADRDMDHHGRRLAGDPVVAMRHRHRDVFVRHGNDLGIFAAAVGIERQRLDERRKIRPGIGKYVIDAAFGEARPISLRRDVRGFGIAHRPASVLFAFPRYEADWAAP